MKTGIRARTPDWVVERRVSANRLRKRVAGEDCGIRRADPLRIEPRRKRGRSHGRDQCKQQARKRDGGQEGRINAQTSAHYEFDQRKFGLALHGASEDKAAENEEQDHGRASDDDRAKAGPIEPAVSDLQPWRREGQIEMMEDNHYRGQSAKRVERRQRPLLSGLPQLCRGLSETGRISSQSKTSGDKLVDMTIFLVLSREPRNV